MKEEFSFFSLDFRPTPYFIIVLTEMHPGGCKGVKDKI